jgi:6-phosphofructo-2-kinase
VENNIRVAKLNNPDYAGQDPEQAVQDFKARIQQYLKCYEPLDWRAEPNISYIKSFNAGNRVEMVKVRGLK